MSRRSNQKNQPQTKTQKPKLGQELIIFKIFILIKNNYMKLFYYFKIL